MATLTREMFDIWVHETVEQHIITNYDMLFDAVKKKMADDPGSADRSMFYYYVTEIWEEGEIDCFFENLDPWEQADEPV